MSGLNSLPFPFAVSAVTSQARPRTMHQKSMQCTNCQLYTFLYASYDRDKFIATKRVPNSYLCLDFHAISEVNGKLSDITKRVLICRSMVETKYIRCRIFHQCNRRQCVCIDGFQRTNESQIGRLGKRARLFEQQLKILRRTYFEHNIKG